MEVQGARRIEGRGKLYVVSTPIGNLGDISFRALDVLQAVALILAEDTRHSRTLLDHYRVVTPTTAYHEHNEAAATPGIIARLERGEDVALISDAGTPLLSDPGARLVSAAIEAGISVVPIPGASALLAALAAAGLGAERFTFFGFLPRRGKDRSGALLEIVDTPHTVVLYEAPPRIAATLKALAEGGAADRACVVGRELTKKFEEFRRGTVAELAEYYAGEPPRGEIVLMLGPRTDTRPDEAALRELAGTMRKDGASAREITRRLMDEHGAPRNLAYRLAHE